MIPMGKAGRPSEYKPEYCQKLLDYFGVQPYKKEKVEVFSKNNGVEFMEVEKASDFPTVQSFAIELGVSSNTLRKWAKKHKEFGEVYERVSDYQTRFLTVNGLKGLIDRSVMIFTAKNTIQWRDKLDSEKDNTNISITLADEIAKARARVNNAKTNKEDE